MRKLLLSILIALTLNACRWAMPDDAPDGTWVSQRQDLFAELEEWRVHGRLAISNGEDGGSAGFVLHDNHAEELRLNLSATGGRWRLLATADGAELEGSRIPLRRALSPEPLIEEALGWYLPVTLMRDWIRGLPAPAGARLLFGENGSLKALQHSEWNIEYQRFREVDGFWLPQKIVAKNGPYRVTLLVLGWRLGPETQVS